jgi:UDP-N-acetylmuramoyl-tripeptide--D-alanyl-D-alanine ligase
VQRDQIDAALAHRARLDHVTFVGITGSCGKTTTKDLAAGLLHPTLRGSSNPGSGNCGADVVQHVLRVKPTDAYCIQELGAWGPGTLDAGLELLQPEVGVVLNIRRDHYSAFRGLANTQAEKAKAIECLPSNGIAILNADDPHVSAMRHRTRARVITFGRSPDADFRVQSVCASWPDRLSFELFAEGDRYSVRTQLLGEHLVGSAVAAIALAHTMGVPLDAAVERLAQLPPTERRMSQVMTESGIAFVRDDFKAPSDSLDEILNFLAGARATRKVAVIGRISDHPGRSRSFYTTVARAALNVAELLVFVGDRPEELWGGTRRLTNDFLAEFEDQRSRMAIFATVHAASNFLRDELRAGDLVVLKGSGPSDHLERILLEHQTTVQCWRAHCGLVVACESCDLLASPAGPADTIPAL